MCSHCLKLPFQLHDKLNHTPKMFRLTEKILQSHLPSNKQFSPFCRVYVLTESQVRPNSSISALQMKPVATIPDILHTLHTVNIQSLICTQTQTVSSRFGHGSFTSIHAYSSGSTARRWWKEPSVPRIYYNFPN